MMVNVGQIWVNFDFQLFTLIAYFVFHYNKTIS